MPWHPVALPLQRWHRIALLGILLQTAYRQYEHRHLLMVRGSAWKRLLWHRTCTRKAVAVAASRREALLGSGALALRGDDCSAVPAARGGGQSRCPLCEMALHRLQPLPGQVGGMFASVSASVDGMPIEMMLDSGLSSGMVTPALAEKLKLRRVGDAQGSGVGGAFQIDLVSLLDLKLACGETLSPITAAVSDFSQEDADQGLRLSGMLGYQALEDYDADIDFPRARLRLWRPGEGVAVARTAGMREVEGVAIPGRGILGVRIMNPEGRGSAALGIVDTGVSSSVISDAAAPVLGARVASSSPEMVVMGVDGQPMVLRISGSVALPLGGAPLDGGGWETAITLGADDIAVGDLPELQELMGGGSKKPVVLLGLDVLDKHRLIFAAPNKAEDGIERRLFISA